MDGWRFQSPVNSCVLLAVKPTKQRSFIGILLDNRRNRNIIRGYRHWGALWPLRTAPCTFGLLKRADELISWVTMKTKPTKSPITQKRTQKRPENTIWVIGGEKKKKKITLLHKQPIKSLERCHSIELLDQQMGRTVMDGLERSDNSNFLERRRHLSHKNIHQKSLKAQCSHTNPCSTWQW